MVRDYIHLELRDYWALLIRRWPFFVVPASLVAVLALITLNVSAPPPTYIAGLQFIVGQPPSEEAIFAEDEQRHWSWITSQYVVNSVTDWVNGTEFSKQVADVAYDKGLEEITAKEVFFALNAYTLRSRLTVNVETTDEEDVIILSQAVIEVLRESNRNIIPQLGSIPAEIKPIDVYPDTIDELVINPVAVEKSMMMDIFFRVFVAAATGVGFAMMIEYIDPKFYSRHQVSKMGLDVMGTIPAKAQIVVEQQSA